MASRGKANIGKSFQKKNVVQSKVEKLVKSHQRQPTKEVQGHDAVQRVYKNIFYASTIICRKHCIQVLIVYNNAAR